MRSVIDLTDDRSPLFSIRFSCPNCEGELVVDDIKFGEKRKDDDPCNHCGQPVWSMFSLGGLQFEVRASTQEG